MIIISTKNNRLKNVLTQIIRTKHTNVHVDLLSSKKKLRRTNLCQSTIQTLFVHFYVSILKFTRILRNNN